MPKTLILPSVIPETLLHPSVIPETPLHPSVIPETPKALSGISLVWLRAIKVPGYGVLLT